jgi:hypothetical protein
VRLYKTASQISLTSSLLVVSLLPQCNKELERGCKEKTLRRRWRSRAGEIKEVE